MNSGTTAERVYDAVKRRVLTGTYRPGERIEVAALADALDSSNTPVRDALHLMVGERLVETRAGDGFHLPHLDVALLTDLYEWNAQILLLSLRGSARRQAERPTTIDSQSDDPGDVVGEQFATIVRRGGNIEHLREIQSTNDRLHAVRIAGSKIIADWREEIDAIAAKMDENDVAALRRLISSYHRRRQRLAIEILRELYQPGLRS